MYRFMKRYCREQTVSFKIRHEWRRRAAGVLCCIGVVAVFCQPQNVEDTIIARVGNSVMTQGKMREVMSWEGMGPDKESDFVDRWVNRELLCQEARRLGLDKAEELRWEMELVEKEYLIQKLLETHFAEKVQISEEEIASYYEENKDIFQVGEDEVRAQHILTNDKAEADRALQEIRAGKPFEDVARERSVGLFREQGGDMGFFRREDVINEIARVAFRLSEGRVSTVFQSAHGYHIIKVVKKHTAGQFRELTDVHDEILERIRVGKERSVYYDLLYQLQNKTKVYISVPQTDETVDSTEAR